MKILSIHSEGFSFNTREKATALAEDIIEEEKVMKIDDKVLVAFTTIEKKDESNVKAAGIMASDAIGQLAKDIGEKKIILYPYAHLSTSLAGSKTAIKILHDMEKLLKDAGFDVYRIPFGWYKSFKINNIGHSRAESLRSINVDEYVEKRKEEIVEVEKSTFHVLDLSGNLVPYESFNYQGYEDLQRFMNYEVSGSREVTVQPPHTKLMKKLELVDYESRADPGHMRWYPRGELIRNILIKYLSEKMQEIGAMQVETPVMFTTKHPIIQQHLKKWAERQYLVKSGDKTLFLRFASDFGLFFLLSDLNISYRNLPMRMYELTKYSFRHEQSGEVVGLRRLRAFTMPDLHTLCKNVERAVEEFERQYRICINFMNDIEIDYEVGFRVVKEFWDVHKDWILSLIKKVNKPALIEIYPKRTAYWIMKFEFNFVDFTEKAAALPTIQIDVDMARQYGIQYTNENGDKVHPIILHCSPSGALERVVYATLEKAAKLIEEENVPMFPLWLAPTQVRVIPVKDEFIEYSEKIIENLEKNQIRVDLDDRSDSVGKKIRNAGQEWIPYIIVVGEKEVKSNNLSVRIRKERGKISELTLNDFIDLIKKEITIETFLPLPEPLRNLKNSPIFI
ncbi:MAG: threonine--tRNA ligase [Candidatus Helarchaeota archaeon]|nr:threonine--tRNA ligase [Candidatus Helarchaeota archaeon]